MADVSYIHITIFRKSIANYSFSMGIYSDQKVLACVLLKIAQKAGVISPVVHLQFLEATLSIFLAHWPRLINRIEEIKSNTDIFIGIVECIQVAIWFNTHTIRI